MSPTTLRIAFLVYPGFTALDVVGPYEVLHRLDGVETMFVWKEPGPVVTDSAVLVIGATHSFSEVREADVLIVPGSAADTPTMMADLEVMRWIRAIHARSTITASVCSGALLLAAAEVLDGLPATTHWFGMSALRRFGAFPRPDERVVRAGKVITAAGVSAGIDMALCLAAQLRGEDAAKTIQLYVEYDPRPPFDAGHVTKADPGTLSNARRLAAKSARNTRNAHSISTVFLRRWVRWLRSGDGAATASVFAAASRAAGWPT